MAGPTPDFWQQRFETRQTGWDRGAPSPQLLAWLDAGVLAPCRIAVPGCGQGWEVVELARRGFEVVGLDYTPAAVEAARARVAAAGVRAELIQADVLAHAPAAAYDAVYEQTCLCALHPDHWVAYAAQLHAWLRPGGMLWLLAMQAPRPATLGEGRLEGPPYHCDMHAVRALLPEPAWAWPRPPYPQVPHPSGWHEFAVPLQRR
ncbi:methyltransferase domain-containing protein [Piscinibacter sakaiensis]|uniref:Thiol methyltransferase n=1 Tax=Piscinibacter sakaiensis TaxID=1547922 RepID=A0A0K8P2C8_PISS1|nr:methyltransferase domain-containing protein [Piscinibacter sakaiensis]GAP36773.1 thiol methyltransferase [Piscinibacter sakaiensis]